MTPTQTEAAKLPINGEYEWNPAANIFPLMDEQQLRTLAADIAANGLKEAIWLDEKGRVLDGRNRLKACKIAGVEPRFRTYKGTDPLAFVLSLNLHRRHLTSEQKAALGAEIEQYEAERARERQRKAGEQYGRGKKQVQKIAQPISEGRAREKAAEKVGTNRQYVSDAKRIREKAPDVFERMKDGKYGTMADAKRVSRLPLEDREEVHRSLDTGKAKSVKDATKKLRRKKQEEREREATKNLGPLEDHGCTITAEQAVVSCDALITDPPYGILDEEWEPSDLKAFTVDWLTRWNPCEADFLAVFWSQRFLYDGRKWFDAALQNYRYHQTLVWHYPNNKSPQSRQGFKQTWEPILFYRRKGSEKEVTLKAGQWGDGINDFDCHVAAVPQSNFKGVNRKQHPAQKPLSVMEWLVVALTDPGDLIADPFCGSGTTGVAALKYGRAFHGIEVSDEYSEAARRRVATYAT